MIESAARIERISTDSSPRSSYHWEVPQKPVSVNLLFDMIDRLDKLVVENFRSLTSRGSEIGGILLGRATTGSSPLVTVEEFELVSCDYSRGPLFRLSDADMARFERAIEQHATGATRAVGFFRSHTRKGLALDPEDVSFLDIYFREANHIALLVRPYASKPSTGGIFLREDGVIRMEASYLEFPFRSSELTASVSLPADPPPAAPAAQAPPAPPKPSARAQIVPIASRREISSAPPQSNDLVAEPAPTAPAEPAPVEVRKPAEPAPRAEEKPARKDERARKDEKPEKAPVKVEAKAAPEVKPAADAKAEVKKPEPESRKAEPEKTAVEKDAAKAAPKAEKTLVEKDAAKPAPKAEKPLVEKETPKVVPQEAPAKPELTPFDLPEAAPRRGKALLVAGLVAVLGLGVGGYFMFSGHKASPIPTTAGDTSPLNLRVEHSGADLLLTWNRDAAVVKGAAHAVLSISDGERQENYDMDPGQLANGSIVYSPLTPDVSFRLEVTGRDQVKTASESVRVLRTRPSPMPDDPKASKTQAATTTTPAAPGKNDSTAAPSAPAETAAPSPEEPPVEKQKLASPSRAFDSSSLSKRLRPASQSDLPDAPTVGRVDNTQQAALPGGNLVGMAPPPAPKAPAPPPPSTATPRAGGQITQAQLLVRRDPEYPKIAQQMGVRGTVELIATIGADGKVKKVKVISGHQMLVKAASDAVMQWVYQPTLLNGTPVENETHIKIDFAAGK